MIGNKTFLHSKYIHNNNGARMNFGRQHPTTLKYSPTDMTAVCNPFLPQVQPSASAVPDHSYSSLNSAVDDSHSCSCDTTLVSPMYFKAEKKINDNAMLIREVTVNKDGKILINNKKSDLTEAFIPASNSANICPKLISPIRTTTIVNAEEELTRNTMAAANNSSAVVEFSKEYIIKKEINKDKDTQRLQQLASRYLNGLGNQYREIQFNAYKHRKALNTFKDVGREVAGAVSTKATTANSDASEKMISDRLKTFEAEITSEIRECAEFEPKSLLLNNLTSCTVTSSSSTPSSNPHPNVWASHQHTQFLGPRCDHVEHWKRLRGKRGYDHYICHKCGTKWRIHNQRSKHFKASRHSVEPTLSFKMDFEGPSSESLDNVAMPLSTSSKPQYLMIPSTICTSTEVTPTHSQSSNMNVISHDMMISKVCSCIATDCLLDEKALSQKHSSLNSMANRTCSGNSDIMAKGTAFEELIWEEVFLFNLGFYDYDEEEDGNELDYISQMNMNYWMGELPASEHW